MIICGDFNSPDIPWTSQDLYLIDTPLVTWASDNYLTQHVVTPTRPSSQSVLDLVFTDLSTHIDGITVEECFGSSDHSAISFSVLSTVDISAPQGQYVSNFSRANWRLYCDMLMNSYWPCNPDCTEVDSKWLHYLNNIQSAANAAIPRKPKSPWSPLHAPKVRTALRSLRRANKAFHECPTL